MCSRLSIAAMLLAITPFATRADNDLHGDPLPDGARARLGTIRYRYGINYNPIITPDGKTIFASDNFGVRRYDISGVELKPLPNMPFYIPNVFSADGKRAVSASNTVNVWDTANGKNIISLKRAISYHDHALPTSDISADGKVLVVGATRRDPKEPFDVLVWDVDANKEIVRIVPPQNEQALVALSPDGKIVATWGKYQAPPGVKMDYEKNPGRDVSFFDAASGKPLATVRSYGYHPNAVTFSQDSTLAAVGGASTVQIVDPRTGAAKQLLLGRSGIGQSVSFSPDGSTLCASSFEGIVQRWRTSDGVKLSTTEPPVKGMYRGSVRAMSAEHAIGSGWRAGNFVVWDVPSGKLLGPQTGHTQTVSSLMVTADSKFVLSSAYDNQSLKWEIATGKLVGPAPGFPWTGRGGQSSAPVEFSRGGLKVLMADLAGHAIHDGVTGMQEYVIPTRSGERATFTTDGAHAVTAVGSQDAKNPQATLNVWNVASAKLVFKLKMSEYTQTTGTLTPDGKHVVTVSRKIGEKDKHLLVVNTWETPGGAKKSEYSEEADYGLGGIAIGDNDTAAVITSKGKLLRYDIATGKATPIDLKTDRLSFNPAFSADGKSLAVFGYSAFGQPAPVFVLDWPTGKIRHTFTCPDRGPASAAFSPDGRWLVVGTYQCTALVWELAK